MRASFIGAGNVASHLAVALDNAGHEILEIYSRDGRNARQLVKKLYDTAVVSSLDFSKSKAEIIFLTVPDDAINEVIKELILPDNCIVVHTSGAKSLEEISKYTTKTGVFYPLQTFSKDIEIDITKVPFCIEADDELTEDALIDLANDLSDVVYLVNSKERRVLHLGAVFACNFTNHLLAVAKRITENEDLEFALLKPLIQETIRKALDASDPATVQTGPAKRNDTRTMKTHLMQLEGQSELQSIYELISQNIRNYSRQTKG